MCSSDLSEISLVKQGDNPGAIIKICKTAPPEGESAPEAAGEDLEKSALIAELAKAKKDLADSQAQIEKAQAAADLRKEVEFCKSAGISDGIAESLATLQKSAPDQLAPLRAELVRLAKAAASAGALERTIGTAGQIDENPQAAWDALVKKHQSTGLSFSAAIVAAEKENPALYPSRS